MQELIPVLAGAVFGAVAHAWSLRWLSVCVGVGAMTSVASGELGHSALFAVWDVTQCAVAFVATRTAVRATRRPSPP